MARPMSVPDEIGRSRYISLTTYRKDGTPVATPVWHVAQGRGTARGDRGELVKVQADPQRQPGTRDRVRHTRQDAAGAASADGTARLLDETGTADARQLLARRYVMSRVGNWFARILRLRRPPMMGIAVTF